MDRVTFTALRQLSHQPHATFREASEAALRLLVDRFPRCALIVGWFDEAGEFYRVLDARGRDDLGIVPATVVPLDDSFCIRMAAGAPRLCRDSGSDSVYGPPAARLPIPVRSYAGVPLELSDGRRVGSVCAISDEPHRFGHSDVSVLSIAGRLLSYELERELRERPGGIATGAVPPV